MEGLREEIETIFGKSFRWDEIEEGLNTIYQLSSNGRNLILKVHTNEKMDLQRFNAEPEIYEIIEDKTSVPSPEVVYRDESEDELPAFYVMDKIEGQNGSAAIENLSKDSKKYLFREYGRMLGEIHRNTSFEEHGLIFKNGDLGTEKGFDSWKESFKDLLRSNKESIRDEWSRPPSFRLNPDKLAELLPEAEPVIIHHDNRLENLVLEDKEIKGFLDWSFTRAGHSEYDLVIAEYLLLEWENSFEDVEPLREKLFEGYAEIVDFTNDEDFGLRRDIYRYSILLWLMAGLSNWGPENPEKYRELEEKLREDFSDIEERLEKKI